MNVESRDNTTLQKLADRVAGQASFHRDSLVPIGEIPFPDGLSTMYVSGDDFPMTENARRQMSSKLGIPYTYLSKCPERLQEINLSHWLRKEERDNLFVRFDGMEVRAVFSERYKPTDNVQIIDKLFDMGYSPETRLMARLSEEFMSISITDDVSFDLTGGGDKIHGGISIANSEIGLSSVVASAYIYRIVCSNGMLGKVANTSRKRHISDSILEDLAPMIDSSRKQLPLMRKRFRISLDSPVDNPESTFETLGRQFQLSEQEREATLWGYAHEPGEPPAMFHIANAYTKGANFPGLPAKSADRLERAGGMVIDMVKPSERRLAA